MLRVYSHETKGYFWRVLLTRNRQKFRRDFFDARCGGEQEALRLAQAWRDKIVAEHPAMPLDQYCAQIRANNTSGVSGVSYAKGAVRDEHGNVAYYPAWNARIPLGGDKMRTVRFAVSQYGEEGAKERAIAARMQGLAELKGMILRESCQPQAVSTPQDIARLEALLRAPQERHDQEIAERHAREQYREQRVAERLALVQSAEQQALQQTNSSGEPYISRRYNASGKGCWAVSIKRLGKCYTKSFSDATNDGASGALARAKIWRDEVFNSLPVISKAQAVRSIKARSQSGATGVYPLYGKGAEKPVVKWIAHCPKQLGEISQSKSFSVAKYGEKEAFSLALKARAEFVAELDNVPHLPKHAAQQMLYAAKKRGQSEAGSANHIEPGINSGPFNDSFLGEDMAALGGIESVATGSKRPEAVSEPLPINC